VLDLGAVGFDAVAGPLALALLERLGGERFFGVEVGIALEEVALLLVRLQVQRLPGLGDDRDVGVTKGSRTVRPAPGAGAGDGPLEGRVVLGDELGELGRWDLGKRNLEDGAALEGPGQFGGDAAAVEKPAPMCMQVLDARVRSVRHDLASSFEVNGPRLVTGCLSRDVDRHPGGEPIVKASRPFVRQMCGNLCGKCGQADCATH